MGRFAVLATLALAGCQVFLAFDTDRVDAGPADAASAPDVVPSADADADGASDVDVLPVGRCDRDDPFEAPRMVPGLSKPGEDETSLRPEEDELSGYAAKESALWRASRPDTDAAWTLAQVDVVGLSGYRANPFFVADTNELVFHAGLPLDLHVASLASPTQAPDWEVLDFASGASDEADPWVVKPSGTLYFTRRSSSGSSWEIVRSVRMSAATYATPSQVAGLGAGSLVSPLVTSDEKTIYFAADTGSGFDMYRATREDVAAPFTMREKLSSSLNTADEEYPRWISADECVLYFHRGAEPNGDLYRAERRRGE